jgi:hypothetical protein
MRQLLDELRKNWERSCVRQLIPRSFGRFDPVIISERAWVGGRPQVLTGESFYGKKLRAMVKN